jgi:16S rRNA (guanine966-N2)-methyltransferase
METLGLNGVARILRRDASNLGTVGTIAPFALAFADPPYGKGLAEKALKSASEGGWLRSGALCVLEDRADTNITLPSGFGIEDKRASGDTQLVFATYNP